MATHRPPPAQYDFHLHGIRVTLFSKLHSENMKGDSFVFECCTRKSCPEIITSQRMFREKTTRVTRPRGTLTIRQYFHDIRWIPGMENCPGVIGINYHKMNVPHSNDARRSPEPLSTPRPARYASFGLSDTIIL
jgi:hypothetical protein